MARSSEDVLATVKEYNKGAVQLMKSGEMDDANAKLQAALQMCSEQQDIDDSLSKDFRALRAATLNNLGCLFKRMSANQEALMYLLQARDLEVNVYGAAGCSTLVNLSTVLAAVGSLDDALGIAKQCVKISMDGSDDQMVVMSLHNLAVTQESCGPAEKKHASTTMLRALRESRERLGHDHPTTRLIERKCSTDVVKRKSVQGKPKAMVPHPPTRSREQAQDALRTLQFSTPEEPHVIQFRRNQQDRQGESDMRGGGVMEGAVFTENKSDSKGIMPKQQLQQQQLDQPQSQQPPSSTENRQTESLRESSEKEGGAASLQGPEQHQDGSRKESKTQAAPRTRQAAFSRFAVGIRDAPPPVPISFTDIREEIRATRRLNQIGSNSDVTAGEARAADTSPKATSLAARAQKRKAAKKRSEEEEETQMRLRKAKAEEAQRREEERAARAEAVLQRRRNHAARIIQRLFRRWYITARAKRPRVVNNRGGALFTTSTADPIRIIKKYAHRWLDKTAGPRLAIRITGKKKDLDKVIKGVCGFQRIWRMHSAQARRQAMIRQRSEDCLAVVAMERLHFAAMLIQGCFRVYRARRAVDSKRAVHYREFVSCIQRWGRCVLTRRSTMRGLVEEHMQQHRAAVSIQSCWRRHQALLTYSVMLLKQRIARMRGRDHRAAAFSQRVGRAFQERRALCRYRAEEKQRAIARRSEVHLPVPARTPEVPSVSDEARDAAQYQREVDRELYFEMAVESQRKQVISNHTHTYNTREVHLKRETENHRRDLELQTLRRYRAAKLIQRVYRRFRTLDSFEQREHRVYQRAAFQKQHYDQNQAKLEDAKRRAAAKEMYGDTAAPARAAKEETLREIRDLGPIRTHLPDEALIGKAVAEEDRLREIEEREATARQLKQDELALEYAIRKESEALRSLRVGGKLFRTVKEERTQKLIE